MVAISPKTGELDTHFFSSLSIFVVVYFVVVYIIVDSRGLHQVHAN